VNAEAYKRRPLSLRLRLVLLATIVLAISLSLVGWALDSAFHESSEASLKARMESMVYLMLAATEVEDGGTLSMQNDLGDPRLGQPGSGVYARVKGPLNQWGSPSSVGIEFPELSTVSTGDVRFLSPSPTVPFYSLQYGVAWELPTGDLVAVSVLILTDPQEFMQELKAFRAGMSRSLVATGVILVLAQLLFLALSLRPLRKITQDIAGIESGNLERLEGAYPKEMDPMVRNLNHLLETEKANQSRYQNALDSLAHSLKTPLSVIRASLPVDTAAKSKAVENSVDDMQHLIATRLQRAAASTRSSMAQAVDVKTQVDRLVSSLQQIYSHKMINIDANIQSGLVFYGENRDLMEVLGNLLDNASKYGQGKVRIKAVTLDDNDPRVGIDICVEDNGAGIAGKDREQLLQRGVRGDERVEGSGLGLAIVVEIVNAYNGEISIGESPLGGAAVSVQLRTR
jgi:two-component system sensor histidine kinase PhoQ